MTRQNRRDLRPLLTAVLTVGLTCAPVLAVGLQALPSTYSSTIVDWPKGKTGTVRIGGYASAPVDVNGQFSIVLPTLAQLGSSVRPVSGLFAEKSNASSDEVCKGQGTSAPENAQTDSKSLQASIDGGSPVTLKLNSDPHVPFPVGQVYSNLLYFDVPTTLDGSVSCEGFTETFIDNGRNPGC